MAGGVPQHQARAPLPPARAPLPTPSPQHPIGRPHGHPQAARPHVHVGGQVQGGRSHVHTVRGGQPLRWTVSGGHVRPANSAPGTVVYCSDIMNISVGIFTLLSEALSVICGCASCCLDGSRWYQHGGGGAGLDTASSSRAHTQTRPRAWRSVYHTGTATNTSALRPLLGVQFATLHSAQGGAQRATKHPGESALSNTRTATDRTRF